MEKITNNMQKYANYKEQMGRLKKALNSEFYLEAIFIEYAVMEDRLESILRHSGKWHPKPDQFVSIDSKRKKVVKLAEEKRGLARKYFSAELTDSIEGWVTDRNQLIHALMKQNLRADDLAALAVRGQEIARILCNKTKLYNRALDRAANKKEKHHG